MVVAILTLFASSRLTPLFKYAMFIVEVVKVKTVSQILEIIENRVRNFVKMKGASRDIDQRRKKAPAGWDSVQILRQIRQVHR